MKRRWKIWQSDSFEIKRIKIFDSSEFKRQVKLPISILLKTEESEFLILLKSEDSAMGKIYHIGRDTQTFQGVTHSLWGLMHKLWWVALTLLGSPYLIGVTHILSGVFHTLWGSSILR
jgi:hypothetical protein